jgi:hypothetical protein
MHACIRATRSCSFWYGFGLQWLQSGLDRALHRGQVGLALPSCKGRAIIFQF